MTSHVDEQIQARIAAAKKKRQQQRQQRAELDANRQAGLNARKTAKLRYLRGAEDHAGVTETVTVAADTLSAADGSRGDTPTTLGQSPTVATPSSGAADGNCGHTPTVASVSPTDADDE